MQFYTLNDDNSTIAASADFRWAEDCLETDREIVRGWDGKLYFAGDEPEKPPPVEIPKTYTTAELFGVMLGAEENG